ncbi:MAG: endolytic transglycosylase MltG [Bacteroidales bacterium]|nr:endolytic transglycosylase MltG [Bacteroidales bacterium]
MKKKSLVLFIVLLVLSAALFVTGKYYFTFYHANIITEDGGNEVLLVPYGSSFDQLMDSLTQNRHLTYRNTFLWAAQQKKLMENVIPGRYEIWDGMTNKELVRKLSMGWQDPLNITLSGTVRTFERLAQVLSGKLAMDEETLLEGLRNDSLVATYGFDSVSLRAMFIPNTYQVYWTISVKQLLDRMFREYKIFWTPERKEKAKEIGLDLLQVSTLASIVYEETKKVDEMQDVAGVYMNRLRIGMPLQADPTLIFAAQDYSIRRVLQKHTKIESPYNTYKYRGLPPGPISVPSIEAIDAVLHYNRHNYYYFCAREDFSGYHNFAATHGQHMTNARRFQKALTERLKNENNAS